MSVANSVLKKIISFFFQGILYSAPVFVTGYVIYSLFTFFDGLIPVPYIGLSIAIMIVVMIILGFLGSRILVRPLLEFADKVLGEIPFIKVIYSSAKDFLSAFVGNKKKFSEAVLVELSPGTQLYKLGFITKRDMSALGLDETMVTVYFPQSYAVAGNLFIVPADRVKKVDISASEAMKFIVSGGVTDFDNKNS
ncbi:MAG: DUF502 domain-containing protein [Bacteroidota bacterium]